MHVVEANVKLLDNSLVRLEKSFPFFRTVIILARPFRLVSYRVQ